MIALLGTFLSDLIGRKTQALISTSLLTVFLFLVGALTKGDIIYASLCPTALSNGLLTFKVYGTSENKAGIYGYGYLWKNDWDGLRR